VARERRKKEEGRGKREEGRGKREEGRGKRGNPCEGSMNPRDFLTKIKPPSIIVL
jgi:hypothetical protein